MDFTLMCPRCGEDFAGPAREAVVEAVAEHARVVHRHALDSVVVLAHLEGVHPHERDA